MSTRPPSLNNHRGPGEHAAALAASWCSRRVGSAYGRSAWQLLADAARLGLVRHGRPEAWAAGAVIAVARVNGLLGAGRAITAQQVADELDVSLGALAVTDQRRLLGLRPSRVALTGSRLCTARRTAICSMSKSAWRTRASRTSSRSSRGM